MADFTDLCTVNDTRDEVTITTGYCENTGNFSQVVGYRADLQYSF